MLDPKGYPRRAHYSRFCREQRSNRVDRRRQIVESAEAEKENERQAEECEKDSQEAAVEGLLLLQQSCKMDAQTQTSPPVEVAESPVYPTTPALLYVPVDSGVTRPFGRKLLEGNDECTKFYTGVTSWSIFKHLVTYLSKICPSLGSKLSPFDSVLLTLMRLQLNLRIEDIAYRFGIGASTASDIVNRNIDLMYANLKFPIKWPSQEVCHANMPQVFKDLFPRTHCIIERPCSYQARAQTYSNYKKKHNTVKFLIGITPCGAVSYLSKCWDGRATDKCITMNSDFIRLLEYGDIVLADRYTILQGTLPVTFLKRKNETDVAFIDKVLVVCSALVNMSTSVVPQ